MAQETTEHFIPYETYVPYHASGTIVQDEGKAVRVEVLNDYKKIGL